MYCKTGLCDLVDFATKKSISKLNCVWGGALLRSGVNVLPQTTSNWV
jgi:hypothetical protein